MYSGGLSANKGTSWASGVEVLWEIGCRGGSECTGGGLELGGPAVYNGGSGGSLGRFRS